MTILSLLTQEKIQRKRVALPFTLKEKNTEPIKFLSCLLDFGSRSWRRSSMAENRVGEILGNYTLLKPLGQGSFAEVYLGEHRYLERPAAIKVLHVAISPDNREAFRQEARIIAHLQHPHIVQVFDFGVQDQTPYLVMDYLSNGTLDTRHPRGTRLSLEQIVTYVKQIASALDYAHEQHIIHRDIKPENLLFTSNDEIVVSDFGIAMVQRTLDSLSLHNPAGTPRYMAPEQIQGRPCPASDQYALAVIVYEWLCGAPPFSGSDFGAIFWQQLYQIPPSLCERVPDLPQAAEDAIFGALAKDPGQRFACVRDFANVLEEACWSTQPLRILLPTQTVIPGPEPQSASLPATLPVSVVKASDEATYPLLDVRASAGTLLPPPVQHFSSPPMTHPQTSASASMAQKNRQRLLRRVHSFWIEGVLEHSLHGASLLALGLQQQPEAVAHPWQLVVQHPETEPRPLPEGTRITQVYDQAEGELLILGAPGAGKTTLLLDLARDLINRAEQDERQPIPVVFNLSSWGEKRSSLTDWLVDELNEKYQVPRKLAQTLIETEQLLLLLDGLDEVLATARTQCIETINTYRRESGAPLVVCSRAADYLAQRGRVLLESAVLIQPLTSEQIEQSLQVAGPAFAGIRAALQRQQTVRELVTTPLMLSVVLLTYQGTSMEMLPPGEADLEQRVWNDYVARMVQQRRKETAYSLEDTRRWLAWLARQMQAHQQVIFYAESLQENWLADIQQRTLTWLTIRLPATVLGGCVGLLVLLFILGYGNLIFMLQVGLLGAFVGSCLSQQVVADTVRVRNPLFAEKWAHFRNALLLSLLFAASNGLLLSSLYSQSDWIRDGCILGVGSGFSFWIFQRLVGRITSQPIREVSTGSSLRRGLAVWFTAVAVPRFWLATLLLGIGIGVSEGLSIGLGMGLSEGLNYGLSYGLRVGLNVSVMVVLVRVILIGTIGSLRFAERIHWTWRGLLRPEHLRTSLIVASVLFLFIGLSEELSSGCLYGLSEELSSGLHIGLISGLSSGLSVGLSYWILLGLYQGMKQERLEEQDRQQFNQGIRRSLRNGLLIGLISALIISAIGVLSNGLLFGLGNGLGNGLDFSGLSEMLSTGLSIGLSSWWVLLFPGIAVMWALSGGLTVLSHYMIRWLLARSRRFPWRAQAFLDAATARNLLQCVGGGYRFVHRRLLEYFAALDDSSSPTSPL